MSTTSFPHFPPAAPPHSSPQSIAPADLAARIRSGVPAHILDVRSPAEFEASYIEGSTLRPLDALVASEWRESANTAPLFILCQAGARAKRAAALFAQAEVPCLVIEGGLDAWNAAGLPVVRRKSNVLPLMRQVQIVIGVVSGIGSALAVWKHPMFGLIPLFTGAGLVFAGVSGTCGLALLMARMPWNRASQNNESPAPGATCCTPSKSL